MSIVEHVAGWPISSNHHCYFIAEIGQNHQGSLEMAKELIKAAHVAGADCVKFQKTSLPHKFTAAALQKPYIGIHSWGKTYGEHKQHLEFKESEFYELKTYAENMNLAFSASPKDTHSLKFLLDMDLPFLKIGSGDSEDFILLEEAARSKRPLIISTGMLDMELVDQVYKLVGSHHKNFALLHCVSSYPTQPQDVNLNVIKTYQKRFPDVPIGYSGHETGTSISVAAATLGAKVIERHLTLDKNQKGNDHVSSLLPEEFKSMVTDVRMIEQALGTGVKCLLPCERPCYEKLGKSVVAAKDLEIGINLSKNDLVSKVDNPKGIPAKDYNNVLGRKLIQKVNHDCSLHEEYLN